ncbi:MAG: hypothetical protein ACI4TZ_01215, partial [Christensenellales bacterium]
VNKQNDKDVANSDKKYDNIDIGKHITITKDDMAKTENENKIVNNKMFEITNDRQVVEQVDSIKVERKNGKRIVTKKLRNDKKTGQ